MSDDRDIKTVVSSSTELAFTASMSPEDIIAWLNILPKDARVKIDWNHSSAKLMATWNTLNAYHPGPNPIWTESLKYACPSCDSPVDEYCINLNKHVIKSMGAVNVKNPHAARFALAFPEGYPPNG